MASTNHSRWTDTEIAVLRKWYKKYYFWKNAPRVAARNACRELQRSEGACTAKINALIKAKKEAKQKPKPVSAPISNERTFVTELPAHQDKWFCQFPEFMKGKVKRIFVELV